MDWLNFFRIAGYIALIFGAICTVGVDFLQKRKDSRDDASKDQKMNELVTNVKESKQLLEPFANLARELYPTLSQEEALVRLHARFDTLETRVGSIGSGLSEVAASDSARAAKEQLTETRKMTPPSIEARLQMDHNRQVYVVINFLNEVPIEVSYKLESRVGEKVYSSHTNSGFKLNPSNGRTLQLIKDDFNFRDNLPKEPSELELTIFYESIYFKEIGDAKLRGSASAVYAVDPSANTITKQP